MTRNVWVDLLGIKRGVIIAALFSSAINGGDIRSVAAGVGLDSETLSQRYLNHLVGMGTLAAASANPPLLAIACAWEKLRVRVRPNIQRLSCSAVDNRWCLLFRPQPIAITDSTQNRLTRT
jgi:hypothetical protein